MTTFDRRSLMAATAATVTATEGRGCTKPYDWETMSLEDRNLAFNNVAHVTPEFAQKKTEEWTAATRKLREQRPQHLNLAYGPGERTSGTCTQRPTLRHPVWFISMADTGSAGVRKYSAVFLRVL
jgi:hypothetical protein